MNIRNILIFSISICVFALSGSAVFSQTDSVGATARKNAKESQEFKIVFPEIDGWKKTEVASDPKLGLGDIAHYDSDTGGRVTIYFYNGALKDVSAADRDAILKNQLDETKSAIKRLEEMGIYKNVTEGKDDERALGGVNGKIQTRHSLLYFSNGDKELASEIFIFSDRDNFVKIRASRPKASEPNKTVEAFLTAIDAHFAK